MEENRTDTPEVSQAQQEVNAFDTAALQQFGSTEGSGNDNLPVENAFFQAEGQTTEEAPQTEQAPPVQETPSQRRGLTRLVRVLDTLMKKRHGIQRYLSITNLSISMI